MNVVSFALFKFRLMLDPKMAFVYHVLHEFWIVFMEFLVIFEPLLYVIQLELLHFPNTWEIFIWTSQW